LFRSGLPCLLGLSILSASFAHAGVSPNPDDNEFAATETVTGDSSRPLPRFACLPADTGLDEVVTYSRSAKPNITVRDRLIKMKARCRRGKLVDARRREIRFFHPTCWGNPPPDYLEVQQREKEDLAKLKRRYNVIVFTCNPMMQ